MTFSNYHIYVEMISRIDHMIGQLGAVSFIALECLALVRFYRPAWLKHTVWILIGGFYATLFVVVGSGVARP